MKYTLTRGLSELKTLKARYNKELRDVQTIAVKKGDKVLSPYSSYKPEDFLKVSKASVQSVEDLEKRIIKIKTKIDEMNSTTIVKIGSREMTIQRALVEKSLIGLKESRLQIYKQQLSLARDVYERALAENGKTIENLINKQIEACGTSGKVDANVISEIRNTTVNTFENSNKVEFVDATGLESKIKSLEEEIEDFKTNVDFALSEINSTTFFEIED